MASMAITVIYNSWKSSEKSKSYVPATTPRAAARPLRIMCALDFWIETEICLVHLPSREFLTRAKPGDSWVANGSDQLINHSLSQKKRPSPVPGLSQAQWLIFGPSVLGGEMPVEGAGNCPGGAGNRVQASLPRSVQNWDFRRSKRAAQAEVSPIRIFETRVCLSSCL